MKKYGIKLDILLSQKIITQVIKMKITLKANLIQMMN